MAAKEDPKEGMLDVELGKDGIWQLVAMGYSCGEDFTLRGEIGDSHTKMVMLRHGDKIFRVPLTYSGKDPGTYGHVGTKAYNAIVLKYDMEERSEP